MDGGKHMQRNDFLFSDLLRVGGGQAGAESWADLFLLYGVVYSAVQ